MPGGPQARSHVGGPSKQKRQPTVQEAGPTDLGGSCTAFRGSKRALEAR